MRNLKGAEVPIEYMAFLIASHYRGMTWQDVMATQRPRDMVVTLQFMQVQAEVQAKKERAAEGGGTGGARKRSMLYNG